MGEGLEKIFQPFINPPLRCQYRVLISAHESVL
jgi:hypothetical protein